MQQRRQPRARAGPNRASRPGGPVALLGDTRSDCLGGGSPSQRRGVRERAARQACPEATVSTRGQQPTRPRRFAQRVSAALLHHTASNEGLIVGRPVRNAVLRLVPGMDLRLHPCGVDPAEGHEKCGPRRPTRAGPSCNNAVPRDLRPRKRGVQGCVGWAGAAGCGG